MARPRVGLVLSGGGARGVAAIGVLRAFERHQIPIDLIVGTSMGSIVGGLYAAGYSTEQLVELTDTTQWNDLLSFTAEARRRDLFYDQKMAEDRSVLVIRFDKFQPILPEAVSTGQRLTDYLNILALQGIYHPEPTFDNLRIPFRAIATDLISGKRIILDRGSLGEAMRASMTVPLLFNSVKRDTLELMDGGLISNIPADVAMDMGMDVIVAVDITSPLRPANMLDAPWEVADQIIGIMAQFPNEVERQLAHVVIEPPIGDHLSTDFGGLDSLILLGDEAGEEAIPQIQKILESRLERQQQGRDAGRVFPHAVLSYDPDVLPGKWPLELERLAAQDTLSEQALRLAATGIYRTGEFGNVAFEVEQDSQRTVVLLAVTPHPVLREVRFEGNHVVPTDTLRRPFEPLLGLRLNSQKSRAAMEHLLGMYRDRGLSLARIRRVSFDTTSGTATITLDEGIIYRRDIIGTTKTRDYVIWRELPFKERSVFQMKEAAQGLRNLYSTNLFEQVAITVAQEGDSAQHQVVRIEARERPTRLIRLGLRADNERNIQPSIDVRDENFLGIGSELGARFFGGTRNRRYSAQFKATRIFDSYLTFNLEGYYAIRDVNVFSNKPSTSTVRWNRVRSGEFREERRGGTVSFGTQLERLGAVTVAGRLEHQRVWSIFEHPVALESFKIASIKFLTTVDTKDRSWFPRDGITLNFSYESALVHVPGAVGFTKMQFTYDNFSSLGRHTLNPRIIVGTADQTLPITEQFSLGGQDSFFGLREDDQRGRQILVASLGYRYESPIRIFFDTYLKVRYDFGWIWPGAEQVRIKDLHHGIGIALALDTPIGPAEFAVGRSFFIRKDLLNNPLSFGPVVTYFSVGLPM